MIRSSPSQRHRNSCQQNRRAQRGARATGAADREVWEDVGGRRGRPRAAGHSAPRRAGSGGTLPSGVGGLSGAAPTRYAARGGAGMGSGGEHGWVRMTPLTTGIHDSFNFRGWYPSALAPSQSHSAGQWGRRPGAGCSQPL